MATNGRQGGSFEPRMATNGRQEGWFESRMDTNDTGAASLCSAATTFFVDDSRTGPGFTRQTAVDDEHELAVKQIPEPDPRLSVPGAPRDSPRKTRGTNLLAFRARPCYRCAQARPFQGQGAPRAPFTAIQKHTILPSPPERGRGVGGEGATSPRHSPQPPLCDLCVSVVKKTPLTGDVAGQISGWKARATVLHGKSSCPRWREWRPAAAQKTTGCRIRTDSAPRLSFTRAIKSCAKPDHSACGRVPRPP